MNLQERLACLSSVADICNWLIDCYLLTHSDPQVAWFEIPEQHIGVHATQQHVVASHMLAVGLWHWRVWHTIHRCKPVTPPSTQIGIDSVNTSKKKTERRVEGIIGSRFADIEDNLGILRCQIINKHLRAAQQMLVEKSQ